MQLDCDALFLRNKICRFVSNILILCFLLTRYYGPRQTEIRPEAGKLITGQNNKHMLLFEESSVEDSGTYVCKAINRVGEVSQTITVTVKCK